ncbi:hypothetical protein BBJ28_00004617, partial [Nothophytophthora sp. Chile5]
AEQEPRGPQMKLNDRVELLPGQLDFALQPSVSVNGDSSVLKMPAGIEDPADSDQIDEEFVCMDDDLVYLRFFADFGPLSSARTVRFCRSLQSRLAASKAATADRRTVLYCSDHPHKRANATALLAVFLVLAEGLPPEQALARLLSSSQSSPPFGFRDASCGVCSFFLTALDCARAVHRAVHTSIWSFRSFSIEEYEKFDRLENGDMNWILPGKLLAFSGPQRERIVLDGESGASTLLARDYAAKFRAMGVTCVVRFNEMATYDRKAFVHAGLRHLDLQFPDGSNPSDDVLDRFIRTCERESGAVAVHCKAGLGRTGTAIAAFLMKKHGFTAVEAIAWCRICRPGSIVGPQQHYLLAKQPELHATPCNSKTNAGSRNNRANKPPLQQLQT